ncbi:MAG TPA: OmpH family outer membrane protein [Candidatus Binatia bacterium]|nr:OmpH family outer membrane protein [Candidatus Binatia bacterium]
MKTFVAIGICASLVCSALSAELKVATVDLERLLNEYNRAQEVGKQLREMQLSFQKELEGLRLQGRTLLRETEELQKLSLDNALSTNERETKKRALENKLTDLHAFDVRYDTFRAQRQAELQSLTAQKNKRVIEEVVAATQSIGDASGVNLILNASRANPLASTVLYSKGLEDLTDKVLASLNKRTAPK